jgi:hypothetical protein
MITGIICGTLLAQQHESKARWHEESPPHKAAAITIIWCCGIFSPASSFELAMATSQLVRHDLMAARSRGKCPEWLRFMVTVRHTAD